MAKLTNQFTTKLTFDWQQLLTWRWWWLPLRLSKRLSLLPTTVLLRTTLTWSIRVHYRTVLLKKLVYGLPGIWTRLDYLSLLQERNVLCILVQFLLVNRLMMVVVWRKSVLWKISWKLLKNLQGSIRRYMARVYPGNHCIYTSLFCPAMVDVSVSSQQPRETGCKIIVRLVRDCCTLLSIQKQRMWYWQ